MEPLPGWWAQRRRVLEPADAVVARQPRGAATVEDDRAATPVPRRGDPPVPPRPVDAEGVSGRVARIAPDRRGGVNPERDLVEIVEIPAHPFFLAVQYHPEFRSKPTRAHPLFREFVVAALRHRELAVLPPEEAPRT